MSINIEDNVARIRARMDRAAGGRPVTLVAATKMNDAQAVRRAIAAGVDACGENRVQEMMEKLGQDAYAGAPLHFIGSLQKNKVKFVVGNCDLIHSVNSVELLEAIARKAAALDIVQDVLLEVNIGGEESKSGFAPEELEAAAEAALTHPHIRVLGLMTIPPVETESGGNVPYFEKVRDLYVDINAKLFHNEFKYLSMGMSGDFAEAIRCGATMVRVGTAIFGARNYG